MVQKLTATTPEPQRRELREWFVQQWQGRIGKDITQDDAIRQLHEAGLSIIESAWVFRQSTGLDLGKVKMIVTSHPVWDALVRATEPLHDELEKALLAEDEIGTDENGVSAPVIHGLKLPTLKK
jgi:hypothetical protein